MYSGLLCQLKANASAFPEGISLSSHPFIYRTLKSVHIIQHRYNCYVTICCCVCLGVEMTQVATVFLGIPLWKIKFILQIQCHDFWWPDDAKCWPLSSRKSQFQLLYFILFQCQHGWHKSYSEWNGIFSACKADIWTFIFFVLYHTVIHFCILRGQLIGHLVWIL